MGVEARTQVCRDGGLEDSAITSKNHPLRTPCFVCGCLPHKVSPKLSTFAKTFGCTAEGVSTFFSVLGSSWIGIGLKPKAHHQESRTRRNWSLLQRYSLFTRLFANSRKFAESFSKSLGWSRKLPPELRVLPYHYHWLCVVWRVETECFLVHWEDHTLSHSFANLCWMYSNRSQSWQELLQLSTALGMYKKGDGPSNSDHFLNLGFG